MTYGKSVKHKAVSSGGGEIIRYFRPGHDPYPLYGWTRREDEGRAFLEGPHGEQCDTIEAAFQLITANKAAGERNAAQTLTFLQKYFNRCCDEKAEGRISASNSSAGVTLAPDNVDGEGDGEPAPDDDFVRANASTSAFDDYLHRGDHPIVRDMSETTTNVVQTYERNS